VRIAQGENSKRRPLSSDAFGEHENGFAEMVHDQDGTTRARQEKILAGLNLVHRTSFKREKIFLCQPSGLRMLSQGTRGVLYKPLHLVPLHLVLSQAAGKKKKLLG
jgi:hypothetical protein